MPINRLRWLRVIGSIQDGNAYPSLLVTLGHNRQLSQDTIFVSCYGFQRGFISSNEAKAMETRRKPAEIRSRVEKPNGFLV